MPFARRPKPACLEIRSLRTCRRVPFHAAFDFGNSLRKVLQFNWRSALCGEALDNLRLPMRRDFTVAREGREHLLVPEVLAPCLELLRRFADALS